MDKDLQPSLENVLLKEARFRLLKLTLTLMLLCALGGVSMSFALYGMTVGWEPWIWHLVGAFGLLLTLTVFPIATGDIKLSSNGDNRERDVLIKVAEQIAE